LHRSYENLKGLRRKIEDELIPAMTEEAESLAGVAVSTLSDAALADEIERRRDIYDEWLAIYRQNFIPFAHGMRFFGQVYNDVMKPQDPFEFVHLLEGSKMVSLQRNQLLEKLAQRIQKDPQLAEYLKENKIDDCDPLFQEDLKRLLDQFGDLAWGDAQFGQDASGLSNFLAEMASRLNHKKPQKEKDPKALEKAFLTRFCGEKQPYALELIEMGRASYRLRDDDNIYLGKIEGQWLAAVEEGKKRIENRLVNETGSIERGEIIRALRDGEYIPKSGGQPEKQKRKKGFLVKARQIVGQPAGPGLVVGKARLISKPEDLFTFKAGEILVCDAVDPGMTFVVPLASGIVERRGGMLIHGAIIAREYGLPCVTGAADAAKWIKTGDTITVDGHLGIVIIGEPTIRGD
jgi:pyruvate,water dikinase